MVHKVRVSNELVELAEKLSKLQEDSNNYYKKYREMKALQLDISNRFTAAVEVHNAEKS